MRVTEEQRNIIKSIIHQYDESAQIYLFGSRTDLKKRGGDIDLYVESMKLKLVDKIKVAASLTDKLNDFPIDLILSSDTDEIFINCIKGDLVRL